MPDKQKNYGPLYILLAVVCLGILYFAVHRPLQAAGATERQAARAAEAQVALIQQDRTAHLEQGQDQKLVAAQQTADAALPDTADTGALLSLLQQTALAQGIQLTAVSPHPLQPQAKVMRQPVKVSCEADYFSLLAYLRALEASGRFLQLEEASITSTNGHLHCELTFVAFAMPVETPADDN